LIIEFELIVNAPNVIMSQTVADAQESKKWEKTKYLEYQHIVHPKSLRMSNEKVPHVYLVDDEIKRKPTQCKYSRWRCAMFQNASKPVQF
jgi:hypothetical protein